MTTFLKKLSVIFLIVTTGLAVTSCNLFGFMDIPSGDDQLLAAARGCLDEGDFSCARQYYNQVSSLREDAKQSELSFTDLAEEGLGFAEFIGAFVDTQDDGTGATLTVLANLLVPTAGVDLRTKFYDAWARQANITGDADLQALVRFMTSTALLAAIYAEQADVTASSATFEIDDYTTASTCLASCVNCVPRAASDLANYTVAPLSTLLTATRTDIVGTLTSNVVWVVSKELSTSIDLLGASGIFGSASSFGDAFTTEPSNDPSRDTFVCQIRAQGIGE